PNSGSLLKQIEAKTAARLKQSAELNNN
ncbi:hypothetical protein, partial [Escherichia coli]